MSGETGGKLVNKVTGEVMELPPEPKTCGNCLAWVTKRDVALPFFGGCAKSGQETVHYGDVKFNLYTPNSMPGCRAWQAR